MHSGLRSTHRLGRTAAQRRKFAIVRDDGSPAMVKQITHRRPFNFRGVDTISIVGKSLDAIKTPIPFDDKRVTVEELDESDVAHQISTGIQPDLVHLFHSTGGEDILFFIKDGKLISGVQKPPRQPSLVSRLLSRLSTKRSSSKSHPAAETNPFETTIVPLEDAEAIMAAFPLDSGSREYQRLRRDDGFRWLDLETVLANSPLVFQIDWRESLQDAIDAAANQLDSFGIALDANFDADGTQGTLSIDDNTDKIKYVPNDDDDFDAVIASINRLIEGNAEYRKFKSCEGTDGWQYGVLPIRSMGRHFRIGSVFRRSDFHVQWHIAGLLPTALLRSPCVLWWCSRWY